MTQLISISDAREKLPGLVNRVNVGMNKYIVTVNNTPKAVILSADDYQKLVDLAEDTIDSVKAREYEQENKTKIKWVELKAE